MNFWKIISLLIVSLLYGCANIVAPTGGPKDIVSPVMLEITPENYSTKFNEKQIKITFNEFIQVNNAAQEVYSSPLFAEKPEVKAKGKELIIKLNSELKDSTTYCINFGKSIADLTENNPILNFKYVFSTGEYIDSITIKGIVNISNNIKPEENVLVLLYKNLNDTAPVKTPPDYYAKTNKDGGFEISNLASGTYNIFALKDANNNNKFDLPNEMFAFIDSSITPFATSISYIDTFATDTLRKYYSDSLIKSSNNTDSIFVKDSVEQIVNLMLKDSIRKSKTEYSHQNLLLNLFEEDNKKIKIQKTERSDKHKIKIIFSKSCISKPVLTPLFESKDNFISSEYSLNFDTLTCWLNDSSLIKTDSLSFSVNYPVVLQDNSIVFENDTVFGKSITYKSKSKKNEKAIVDSVYSIYSNISNGGIVDLNKSVYITTESPYKIFNADLLKVYKIIDSIQKPLKYSLIYDTLSPRKIEIKYNWESESLYEIQLDSMAFVNFIDQYSDSLNLKFRTKKLEDYVTLYLNLKNVEKPVIIQFTNASGTVIEEKFANQDSRLIFSYQKPNTYKIKIIVDDNDNEKWDTGNYKLKRQPERVIFYEKELTLKPNFDIELDFDIKELLIK
ncbi:MAG: hypothetical protein A2046_14580 [Bacteroidetes bacterium GWA2_30_7]|nr:MAG: hypothetical protein A2046_14580 [Bacteroidetes bacterium GWA2_30_7]